MKKGKINTDSNLLKY